MGNDFDLKKMHYQDWREYLPTHTQKELEGFGSGLSQWMEDVNMQLGLLCEAVQHLLDVEKQKENKNDETQNSIS